MKNKKIGSAVVLAGIVSFGILMSDATLAQMPNMEKCYGIARAGKNDCGSAGPRASVKSCQGQSTKDGDKADWIFVPKAICEKIVGGSLTAK